MNKYIDIVVDTLKKLDEKENANIEKAAEIVANAIMEGKGIFSFGASHSFILTEEMVYRTGGLMLINPIYPQGMNLFVTPMTQTSQFERIEGLGTVLLDKSKIKDGDVLFLSSVSGRNAVIIDMAKRAKERGITVIGVTSVEYSSTVTSRHSTGKKFTDFCDLVIDNMAPYGDSVVEIDNFPQKVSPMSSVSGLVVMNSIVAKTVDLLVKSGYEPPVFMSANVDGGDEYNQRLLDANKDRIHYM